MGTVTPMGPGSEPDRCRFCAVLAQPDRAYVVIDDADVVGFLDIAPLFPGHTLVVPRTHHETLADLPAPLVAAVFGATQRLASVMEVSDIDGIGRPEGTFVALNNRVSQSVPHLHVHVVPRRPRDGLRGFFWPRTRYRDEDHMAAVAATLSTAYRSGVPAAGPAEGSVTDRA